MHITLIAGARPNFMKIAPLIKAIEKWNKQPNPERVEYRLVHTGQHYDKNMSDTFFEELGIPVPDVNLGCGGGTQAEQTAHIMVEFEKDLMAHPTDIVLVVGDVTSTMACSIVAKKLNTKVCHVEAGIRSWDLTMPEEINRMVTDSLADYMFTTSEVANRNLVRLGAELVESQKSKVERDTLPEDKYAYERVPQQVWHVGNVMIDTLLANRARFKKPQVWDELGLKEKEYIVTPSASDAALLYRRWVRQREEMVDKLSGGKVGYVHIQGMDSPSYRELYSKALGKYRSAEALIVDTRHNGGGWLHDDLVTFLGGKEYVTFTPRGQYIGHEPFNKWTKPSCVLVGEDNYSDASGFPSAYRSLGLGKLIGAPIPGTMTAVWWETQINPSLVFGIPQVGNYDVEKGYYIENHQIEPDILIYNTPESVLSGRDLQLEAAVEEMLRQIRSER